MNNKITTSDKNSKNQSNIKKVVIIGGSASGAACGARLRRLDEKLDIVVFEKTANASYASCGMPYFIGNEIKTRNDLLVTPVPILTSTYNFKLKLNNEVTKIIPDKKEVIVKNLVTNETFTETYDKLVLSMGAQTFFPPIPGIKDTKYLYKLENLTDMDDIKERVEWSEKCVILGGGFIGLEMAEQLRKNGKEVTIIEILPQILAPLDEEMARYAQKELKKNGVNVLLNSGVKKFSFNEKNDMVVLNIEQKLPNNLIKKIDMEVDFVLISTGVRPSSFLAKDANLKVNQRGGIIVNEHLQTSNTNIYACGDLIELTNKLSSKKGYVPLANLANRHGRIVANSIYNLPHDNTFKGAIGTATIRIFDLKIVSVGNPEHYLKRNGIKYIKYYNCDGGRPSYMPYQKVGYRNMVMKVLMTKKADILGFQVIGKEGVNSLGNLMAMAASFGKKMTDLIDVELPYCPFSGHARGIVNMLGLIARGVLSGTHHHVFVEDVLNDLKEKKITLIDVRPSHQFKKSAGGIPGSINIPLTQFRKKMNEFKKDEEIVFVCGVGKMAYWISRQASLNGFTNVKALSGGFLLYKRCYK